MDTTSSKHPLFYRLLRMGLSAILIASLLTGMAYRETYPEAYAVTSAEKQAEVDEAFRRLDALQTELNQLAIEYDLATYARNEAEARMIDAQNREQAAQMRITELQLQLGGRASYLYRYGNGSYLDVLFGAKSFSDLLNAVDLINRVNEQDARMVLETKVVRAEAEAARIEYTEQERLAREYQEQIAAILFQKEIAEENLWAEIVLLQQEAEELLAKEEAEAEAARQAALAYTSGPAGPVSEERLHRAYDLDVVYPFYTTYKISSPFGPRDFDGFHYGVDWACPTGTPVLAIAGGTVVAAGSGGAMGVYVIIAHGNGIRSIYMHNSSLTVSAGEAVSAGEVICYAGSTGNSTGPHLHLQIEIDLTPVNPMLFYW